MLTLRGRLVLVNVLTFLITFVVLAGVLTGQLLNHLYEELDQELARANNLALSHVVMDGEQPVLREKQDRMIAALGASGFVRVLDKKGRISDGYGQYEDLPVVPEIQEAGVRGIVMNQRNERGQPMRVYTQPLVASHGRGEGVQIGFVQAAAVPEEVMEIIEQIWRSLFIATPLALLAAGLAAFWAARKALKPLTMMTQSAAEISADSLSARRLPIPRAKDEVQGLALAFNGTLDRLAAAFTRQRRFTADASHELRTPVTAILGQAQLALNRPRTPEAYQESLRRIQSEAERMQRLIGRMLTLARAEGGQQALAFAPTDVAALARTLIETLAPQADAKGILLVLHAPEAANIVTDADSLTQILLNLLENAIAYTDAGEISVTLEEQADDVCIEIADSGPGIDPAQMAQIFEPFFRADPSRQRQSGGVGLGLALSHELARLIGGTLEASNRQGGGAVFTVVLPVKN